MSQKAFKFSEKRLIVAAVLMIIITAAAVLISDLCTPYLVMYVSDTNTRYITQKAEDGLMFSVEFIIFTFVTS